MIFLYLLFFLFCYDFLEFSDHLFLRYLFLLTHRNGVESKESDAISIISIHSQIRLSISISHPYPSPLLFISIIYLYMIALFTYYIQSI